MVRDREVPGEGVLTRSVMIGWAAGGVGSTTMLYLVNAMLMFFMVTKLEIQPAVAGTMLLLVRLYDGFVDLAVGTLSDRTRSRWGRRRPWMAVGAVVSAIGTVGLFLPPLGDGETARHAQLFLAIMVFFTGYSCFSVPSSAMPAEMTDSYEVRTSLMAWRTFFLQIAGLLGGAGAPWLVALLDSGFDAYLIMALAAATLVAVTMAVAVVTTRGAREGVVTVRDPLAVPAPHALRAIADNRPYVILIIVKFAGYLSIAASGAVGLFFVRDVLGRSEAAMGQIQLVSALIGMATLPLWRRFARGVAKERVYFVALVLQCLVGGSWLLASATEPQAMLILRAALLGFGSSGGLMMSLAMLPDAIAYDVKRTGVRREGVYSGLFEFMQKLAYATAPFIVGVFLQFYGYIPGQTAGQQPASAVTAVRLAMGFLPMIAYGLAGLILVLFYRIPYDPAGSATAPAN